MASSDPRKIRPVQESGQAGYDAEEDPLVELARIVSEDSGFSARRTERAKPRWPEPITRGPSPSELESELMRELESTFAQQTARAASPRPASAAPQHASQPSVSQPVPQSRPLQAQRPQPAPSSVDPAPVSPGSVSPAPASPVRADPAPLDLRLERSVDATSLEADVAEEGDSEELLRSIEEQLGQFERRARASQAPAVDEEFDKAFQALSQEPDSPEEWRPKHSRRNGEADAWQERDPVRVRPPSVDRGQADYRFRGPARDQLGERAGIPQDDDALELRRSEPETPRGEVVPVEMRGRARDADEATLDRADRARRDPPVVPVRFPREARGSRHEDDTIQQQDVVIPDAADVEAEISREFEPRQAEPLSGGRRRAAEEPRNGTAAAREQIGRSAGRAAPRKRRGGMRKALLTAASVIVVAGAGAAAAVYLRSAEQAPSGPPPVIAAPEGAMKVEAPEQQATAGTETVGEAVYNRVAGNAPSTEERVVESAEEPREIARIVLPSQAESDGPVVRQVGEGAVPPVPAEAAEPAVPDEEIGPRRVQTFVVRPDGTVVATEAGATSNPVPAQQQQLAAQTEEIEPVPVATVAIGDPQAAAGAEPAASAASDTATTLRPTASEPAAAPAPAAAEAPAPPAPSEPQVAAVESVPPAAPPAAIPEPTGAAGGYVVQVSSQRTPEQAEASFADLQQRYGSVLGGLNSSIQQADLGERGIYYRVRVGPWATREEAIGVCEALQNAGGECLVTQ